MVAGMRWPNLLAILISLLAMPACGRGDPTRKGTAEPLPRPPEATPTHGARPPEPDAPREAPAKTTVPESARSREVTARQAALLAPRLAAKNLTLGAPVFVRIFKEELALEVWMEKDGRFTRFDTWKIAYHSGTLGPKLAEGDLQSPEGFYFVPPGMLNPNSRFHLAFDIGYPNAHDRALGRTGSFILVHGKDVSTGCFAMTDPGIEEIYTLVEAALRAGQPYFRVHVFPFHMTDANMKARARSPHRAFWENLKEGHDWFEARGVPPDVGVHAGRYVFREP